MSTVFEGVLSNLYLNTASYASPTYVAATLVSDCLVSIEGQEGEASTRASLMMMSALTMFKLSISGKIQKNPTNTTYAALRAAFVARSVINILVLDGTNAQTGAEGFMIDCQIYKWSQDQGLDKIIYNEFEIKPYPSGNAPNFAIVASGAPVLTPT